jgi:hypothetical protein
MTKLALALSMLSIMLSSGYWLNRWFRNAAHRPGIDPYLNDKRFDEL